MLKYKRAIDFPGHKYPSPLEALGIPRTPTGEPRYDDSESPEQIEAIFNGALFFITAHEAAHVVLNHSRSTPENETQADLLAFELLSRSGEFPGGVDEFFGFASYWAPNGGDFEDMLQYVTWLQIEATHPASVSRIQGFGASVYQNSERYVPGLRADLPASDPAFKKRAELIEKVKELAVSVLLMADRIERHTMLPDFFWDALATNGSTLAPTKDSR